MNIGTEWRGGEEREGRRVEGGEGRKGRKQRREWENAGKYSHVLKTKIVWHDTRQPGMFVVQYREEKSS